MVIFDYSAYLKKLKIDKKNKLILTVNDILLLDKGAKVMKKIDGAL